MKRLLVTAIHAVVLVLLLAITARAAEIQGLVAPDSVSDRRPFTFTAPQTIEGEVISVQTVEGVVVQHASSDKYGRVFLAAGLPAGTYLIARASGQPLGNIEIRQRGADALEPQGEHSPQPMQLRNPPQALKLSDSFSLSGHGFSPNFAEMSVSLNASGENKAAIILAATEDQLKLAPIQELAPGAVQLRVSNQATGQSVESQLLLYDIEGNLVRRTIRSGVDQTQLVIRTRPDNLPLQVKAAVVSGPVDFGAGRKETEAVTSDGQAVFPVYAEHGAGPFQLSWTLTSSDPCRDEPGSALQDKPDWKQMAQDEEDAADKDEMAGNSESAAEHRKKAAAFRRSAGQRDLAAKDEEQRAEDYRNAAKGKKRESEQKTLRDQAADSEQNAAKDHEAEAAKKLKCQDKKGAADELRKAQEDYKRAADDYDKTHEATKKKNMNKNAEDEGKQAEQLDRSK